MGERRHPETVIGMIRWAVAIAILAAVVLALLVFPSKGQGPLLNGDFEDGWFYQGGMNTKYTPSDWSGFWAPWEREPEFKRAAGELFPERVYDGSSAAQWFTTWGVHTAGLYQQVAVPKGSEVTFSAHVQAWTSTQDNPALQTGGSYWTWVCIDPTGGTDWHSADVVCSEGVKHGPPPDLGSYEWAYQQITVIAEADYVTVFVKGHGEWAAKHNDCQVDACALQVVVPAAPTPIATATPWPTWTPTLPEPTFTPVVAETAVPTPSWTGRCLAGF